MVFPVWISAALSEKNVKRGVMTAIQHFLNLTEDLICILNEKGEILDYNPRWKMAFANLPHSLFDIICEEYQNSIHHFLKDHEQDVLKIPECRLLEKSGKQCWVTFKIKRSSDKTFWCQMKDIYAQKIQSAVLSEIADACHLGYWTYTSHNDLLEWSIELYHLLEKDPIFFRPSIESMKHIFGEANYSLLNEFFSSTPQLEFENTFQVGMKWFRLKGKKEYLETGNYFLKGIIQDVTKESLKELIQLSLNVELSSYEKGLDKFSIVARTDPRGKIIYANEAFCRISKYSVEELIGQDHRILNSGYHPKSFFKEMWASILEGKSWRGEIKNRAKDGTFYWVDTIIIPIRNSEGMLQEVLSFRYEITHYKRETEQSRVLRNKLQLVSSLESMNFFEYEFESKTFISDKLNLKSFEEFAECLTNFASEDFEKFLGSLKNEYHQDVLFNRELHTLKVILTRSPKGIPLRIDGLLFKKDERVKGVMLSKTAL